MKKFATSLSRALAFVWSFLPWKVNPILGSFLAFLWFDLFRIRRDVILENIHLAFPQMNERERVRLGRASMRSVCRSFFDVIKIPSLTNEWIKQNVIFENVHRLTDYLEKNDKGILFLTLHLGSGDLGGAVISQYLLPSTLISKRFRSEFLDQFWFSLRGRSKTEFIDAHSQRNAYEILAALKKKRGVMFVLDQFMGKPFGLETTFFGHKTGTAYGLSLFAKKTGLPVMPIYNYWGENGLLHICFSEPVALKPDLSETNVEITQKFNGALETIITQHPDQWMWVHRRWKKFE